jgi:hypothetical protein
MAWFSFAAQMLLPSVSSAVSFVNFKSIIICFSTALAAHSAYLFTDFDQIAILDWDKRGHNFASIITLDYSSTRPLRN